MKFFLKDWLSFSKRERLGIIALLLIILLFLAIPNFYTPHQEIPKIDAGLVSYFHESSSLKNDSTSINPNSAVGISNSKLFYFDPNLLDEKGWQSLGISKKTSATILNYRNKGGRFKKPADIRKIWGLLPTDADRLIPFISIPASKAAQFVWKPTSITIKKKIDINHATASDWESLPGIGPVLANRILKFREKLGGFNSTEQVAKTYGISDSVFSVILPFLTILTNDLKQASNTLSPQNEPNENDVLVNINSATVAQLIQSGINEGVAKAIVLYRKQYGKFNQIADLKKIVFINESVYQQIMSKLKAE